jgi:hypothetical protein
VTFFCLWAADNRNRPLKNSNAREAQTTMALYDFSDMRSTTQRLAALVLILGGITVVAADENKRPVDGIMDNSFLIEEAYNQEKGVVQHIFTAIYLIRTQTVLRSGRMAKFCD